MKKIALLIGLALALAPTISAERQDVSMKHQRKSTPDKNTGYNRAPLYLPIDVVFDTDTKYIYAPKNMDLVRGGNFKIAADNVLVKVTVQLVTKFENKRDTTVETRTFVPKFEWDPSLMQTYGTNSMSLLQSHAAGDAVLQRIDNNVIENCRQ